MLHMTGPTGMKVEELSINKARKINRTLVYAVPARCEGWDTLALVSTCFHAIWTIRPATSPNSGEPQRCLKQILNDWLKGEQLSIEIWLWNLQMQPIGSGGVRIPLTRCWLGRWYRYNYLYSISTVCLSLVQVLSFTNNHAVSLAIITAIKETIKLSYV